MTYISQFPSLLELKTILDPSGDQTGNQSSTELFVSLVWFEPSAFMV
jgi:hypothetical protein